LELLLILVMPVTDLPPDSARSFRSFCRIALQPHRIPSPGIPHPAERQDKLFMPTSSAPAPPSVPLLSFLPLGPNSRPSEEEEGLEIDQATLAPLLPQCRLSSFEMILDELTVHREGEEDEEERKGSEEREGRGLLELPVS
jgi:hypothetical protein